MEREWIASTNSSSFNFSIEKFSFTQSFFQLVIIIILNIKLTLFFAILSYKITIDLNCFLCLTVQLLYLDCLDMTADYYKSQIFVTIKSSSIQ